MAIVLRNEGSKINSNINVTPMVDVMLVLLIIFMVITPMLVNGVHVDLAETRNPRSMSDANKRDALILSVMRDGRDVSGNERVTGEALTQRVRDPVAIATIRPFMYGPDARARYGACECGGWPSFSRNRSVGAADGAEIFCPERSEGALWPRDRL